MRNNKETAKKMKEKQTFTFTITFDRCECALTTDTRIPVQSGHLETPVSHICKFIGTPGSPCE